MNIYNSMLQIIVNMLIKVYIFILLKYKKIKYLLIGSKIYEDEWRLRGMNETTTQKDDWGYGCDNWIDAYRKSEIHPHRNFLTKKISDCKPSSILEIGCNCAPNLYKLSKLLKDVKMEGVDINSAAVKEGNKWFEEEDVNNIRLSVCGVTQLERFKDNSFDVLFTDAVLIYIGSDEIDKVMENLVRITKKKLFFLEWYEFELNNDVNGLGVFEQGIWKRNYENLLKRYVPEENINVTKITYDIWPDKNWSNFGGLVEVSL